MKLTNLKWSSGSSQITWEVDGRMVIKDFSAKISNALLLYTGGVAVIEDDAQSKLNCALVINADSTERFRLENPYPWEKSFSFYYFHYVNDELTVVLAGMGGDFAFVVDETTGHYLRSYETR
jgi:hypothetical protein